jgi:hypothetical protein
MTTGHAEGAPGACRRTPDNRDTDAGALARKAPGDPGESSAELAASVRRWVTESGRAAPSAAKVRDPLPDRRPTTTTATTVMATATAPQPGPSARVSDSRVALLVDPAGLDREALAEVLSTVHASYDRPVVSRAYADWTRPGSREQLDILGDHAVQPVHAFASGFGHTLVALTVDALDAVGTYGVDCVVVVADLEAVHPLVIRLRASGTRVVAVGPGTTPPGFRSQADGFIAIGALDRSGAHPVEGRHRRELTDGQA